MKLILLALVASLSAIQNTYSYPNFIGYGYNSCITCHYNPYGNGPLRDYGRALSATAISDRIVYSSETSEDKIAKNSGFLYMQAFNKWVRPSLDYRGMRLVRNLNKDSPKYETIHMQADVNTVIRFNGEDKIFTSISYGYAPTPKSQKNKDVGNYRSREHYLGFKPNQEYGLYLGMMDKVFGIRIPDHIAFSRSVTGLAQNDQTHGLLFHLTKYKFEIGLHTFVGNLDQASDLRQKGASTKIEYDFDIGLKPGISLLSSSSEHLKNTMGSIHTKAGFSKGSSLLFELGLKNQTIVSTDKSTLSNFALLQNHLFIRRGLLAFMTLEYLKDDIEKESEILRLGPGLQYFPFQGVEFRIDLYNTKNYTKAAATKDNWDLAGQLHLWL